MVGRPIIEYIDPEIVPADLGGSQLEAYRAGWAAARDWTDAGEAFYASSLSLQFLEAYRRGFIDRRCGLENAEREQAS